MRPTVEGVEKRAVEELRQAVPELEDRYDELVDIYEEHLGADVVFGELADVVETPASDLAHLVVGEGVVQSAEAQPEGQAPTTGRHALAAVDIEQSQLNQ